MLRRAACPEVDEDLLDRGFVERSVIAERNEITQQRGRGNPAADVLHHHARPVRLSGNRTQAAEQMGVQGLTHRDRIGRDLEHVRTPVVDLALDIESVERTPRQLADRLGRLVRIDQVDDHGRTCCHSQIRRQGGDHFGTCTEHGLRKRVQVQLERLALYQTRRIAGHAKLQNGRLGATLRVQPGQFVTGPDVLAVERQRTEDSDGRALVAAFDRTQQRRRVRGGVLRRLAERQIARNRRRHDVPAAPVSTRTTPNGSSRVNRRR